MKPMADERDCDEIPEGDGEWLCWQILQGCDQDAEEAIDMRDTIIARLGGEIEALRARLNEANH